MQTPYPPLDQIVQVQPTKSSKSSSIKRLATIKSQSIINGQASKSFHLSASNSKKNSQHRPSKPRQNVKFPISSSNKDIKSLTPNKRQKSKSASNFNQNNSNISNKTMKISANKKTSKNILNKTSQQNDKLQLQMMSKSFDAMQYFSQTLNFKDNNKNTFIYKNVDKQNSESDSKRGPSFQRSSNKLSKKYNVSLASLHQIISNSSNIQKQENGQLLQKSQKQLFSNQKNSASRTKKFNNKSKKKQSQAKNFGLTQEQQVNWVNQNILKVQNQAIKKIYQQYKKQVQQPLAFQSQLNKIDSSAATRCVIHNTSLSLYCAIDRQLLCVGCVYSQKNHKGHRIVPLMKSQRQLQQDIQSFKNRIDSAMLQSDVLVRDSSLKQIKIQKQYPSLIHKIQMYYFQIHEVIEQKKREQLEYIQNLRSDLKNQYKIIGSFLNIANNLFVDKLRMISQQNVKMKKYLNFKQRQQFQNKHQNRMISNNFVPTINVKKQSPTKSIHPDTPGSNQYLNRLISKRSTYEVLARFYKILNKYSDQLFDEKKGFQIKLQNFNQVLELIRYKLAMIIPVMKKELEQKGLNGNKTKGFTNIFVENPVEQTTKQKDQKNKNAQKVNEDKNKEKKKNQQKSQNKNKGFSTSPQVPKGLSRRFIEVAANPRLSPKRNNNQKNL